MYEPSGLFCCWIQRFFWLNGTLVIIEVVVWSRIGSPSGEASQTPKYQLLLHFIA